jgi:hypothetical protein
MKSKIVLLLAMFVSTCCFGQTSKSTTSGSHTKIDKKQVPKEIIYEYHKEYPEVSRENWYDFDPAFAGESWREYDPYAYATGHRRRYVTVFDKDSVSYTIIYEKNGKKVSGYKKMNSPVPSVIISAINRSKYKGWTVEKEMEEIFKDKDTDKVKVYRVTLQKGNDKHILYFQQDGSLLKDVKSA